MPTIPIYPQSHPSGPPSASTSGLPQILQTPSGLAILEVQGTINSTAPSENNSTPQSVGKLIFPGYDACKDEGDTSWHKRVWLYVGKYQRLTGEVKKLGKPVAVLRRRQNQGSEGGDGAEALEIVEIVRWKVVFNHRPEPVGGESGAEG